MSIGTPERAPGLFAAAQGLAVAGAERCHWCGGPCGRGRAHDDPYPIVGVRRNPHAAAPGSPWVCVACDRYRLPRVTLTDVNGAIKDGGSWGRVSWLMADGAIRWVSPASAGKLYEFLLQPAPVFCLALLREAAFNPLQRAVVNEVGEVKSDEPLYFTVDGREPLAYTIYELEEALLNGAAGRQPGVRTLVDFLGPLPEGTSAKVEPRKTIYRPAGKRSYAEEKDAIDRSKRPVVRSGGSS